MKAIVTRYHGPTNTRGARIIADDGDGNRVIVSFDHAARDPHDEAAYALCAKMGWSGRLHKGRIGSNGVYVWESDMPSNVLVVHPSAVKAVR